PRMDQPAHTKLLTIPGRPPDLANPAPGCPFAPRCPSAEARCHVSMPPMTTSADGKHLRHALLHLYRRSGRKPRPS
ncbi:oligopeptide/dipeptide ABC transporter ATP-binding protein, partial [Rhizobium ruizarguesonis]